MPRRSRIRIGFHVARASSVLILACGGTQARPHEVAAAGRNATLSLNSALVAAKPVEATPPTRMVSCRGGALCRETVAGPEDFEIFEEANEDCAHRGGRSSAAECPRDRIVASCTLNGGKGPIRIFTYAQTDAAEQEDAVSTMDDLCSAADGTFERR